MAKWWEAVGEAWAVLGLMAMFAVGAGGLTWMLFHEVYEPKALGVFGGLVTAASVTARRRRGE